MAHQPWPPQRGSKIEPTPEELAEQRVFGRAPQRLADPIEFEDDREGAPPTPHRDRFLRRYHGKE